MAEPATMPQPQSQSQQNGCAQMVGSWVPARSPGSRPLVVISAGSNYLITHYRNEFAARCEDDNRLVKDIGSDLTYLPEVDAIFYAGNRFIRAD